MQFNQVIGHLKEKQKLIELVGQNRLPHALLFTNKKGNGAFPLVMALATYLLCTDRTAEAACGECNSCTIIDSLAHPDLYLTFPVFNKSKTSGEPSTCKDFMVDFQSFITNRPYADARTWIASLTKENKQGNIPANECNELLRKLNLRPLLGGAKISIIWQAEFLGNNGNRLLKMIEEPPKNTYIFFIAEEPDKILQTIQSRAQLFALKPYSNQLIQDALIANNIDSEQAKEIALMADGNYDLATHLQEDDKRAYYDMLRAWLNAIYTDNMVGMQQSFLAMDALAKEEVKAYLHYCIKLFEQVIRAQYLSPDTLPLSVKEKNLVKGLKKQGLNGYKLEKVNEEIESAIYHLERNVYKKIVLYNLGMNLQDILLKKEVSI